MNRLSPRTDLYKESKDPHQILITEDISIDKGNQNLNKSPSRSKFDSKKRSQSRKRRELLSQPSQKKDNQNVLKPKYLKGSGELGKIKGSPEKNARFNIKNMKKWLYLDSTISKSTLNGEDTGNITGSNLRELNGEIFKRKLDGGILYSGIPQGSIGSF